MLADGKSNFTIQLSWLKGFDIIASVRHCMGKLAMYATAVGAIEQESWKTKVWGIFEDLNDSFWNSHRVKLCFSMQRSERAVSVSAFYSKKDSELKEVQPLSNYHSILLNALNILLYDVEEELRLIPWTCTCRIWTGGQEDMVMREVDRQLNTYGASLIRKQHTYYVSKQHRLQEHQRQAIKKLCSETIATLKTLNPVMHLIEVKHKTSGSRAVVGCYHDKVAAETIAHTLEKSMPEVDYIEYIITSLCSSAISKKLLRRIDYTDESILQ